MALGAIVWQSRGDCADKMNDGGVVGVRAVRSLQKKTAGS
jgi:hypothetical protein